MKTLLLTFGLCVAALGAYAQNSSDDPVFYNPSTDLVLPAPIVAPIRALDNMNPIMPCGGGTDTLIGTGSCDYVWSTDSLATNIIGSTDSLVIGPLTSDSTFYLTTLDAYKDSMAVLPAYGSTYTGNTRGYYFTAPVDFVMTGFWVPTDVGMTSQNVEVLLFDNQTPPPAYSLSTNAFTSLGYWSNYDPNDTIDVCIPVYAGDVIGIYGNRGNNNSYSAGGTLYAEIAGVSTPVFRTGMQFDLVTEQMHDVWSEAGSSISRVEMFYDMEYDTNTTAINVIVPMPEFVTNTVGICAGDSAFAEGAYQTSAGMYYDTLQTIYGCDSIVTTDLSVNALPIMSFSSDTTCLQGGLLTLTGTPAGGLYTGTAVSGNQFDPSNAGVGSFTINYAYTGGSGCSNDVDATIVVDECASIDELNLLGVRVYPNPVVDELMIALPENMKIASAVLYDLNGSIIGTYVLSNASNTISVNALSEGVYLLELQSASGLKGTYRIVKK